MADNATTGRITGTPTVFVASTVYTITGFAADGSSSAATVDITIRAVPTLSIVEPSGAEVAETAGAYTITYTAADDDTPGATVALYYRASVSTGCSAGLTGWTSIASGLALGTSLTQTVTPAAWADYYICGVVTDGSSTVYTLTSTTFHVNDKPTISYNGPSCNKSTTVNNPYRIYVAGNDADDAATIDLYYKLTTSTGCSGTPTSNGWTAVPTGTGLAENTTEKDWTPGATGTYYICSRITDGVAADNTYALSSALTVGSYPTFQTAASCNADNLTAANNASMKSPHVAVSDDRTAMAVGWTYNIDTTDPGAEHDMAACYFNGKAWEACVALDPGVDNHDTVNPSTPSVVADPNGNFVVAWGEDIPAGGSLSLKARRYLKSSGGWQGTGGTLLNTPSSIMNLYEHNFIATADVNNKIVVSWSDTNGLEYVRRWTGAAWQAAEQIDTTPRLGFKTSVAMASNGDFWAAYSTGTTQLLDNILYIRKYTWGTGWGTPTVLYTGTNTSMEIERLRVVVSPNGSYVAVGWAQKTQLVTATYYRRPWGIFYNAGTWGPATLIQDTSPSATAVNSNAVDVAVNNDGKALFTAALDADGAGANDNNAYVRSVYRVAGVATWGASVQLDSSTSDVASVTMQTSHGGEPKVTLSSQGTGAVTWRRGPVLSDSFPTRRLVGWTGDIAAPWGTLANEDITLGPDETSCASSQGIAMNNAGTRGMAVFMCGAAVGTNILHAVRFD